MALYDLYEIQLQEIKNIITSKPGLKFLILDDDTSKMLTQVFSFTELLNENVLYTEKITNITQKSSTTFRLDKELEGNTAIFFLRPTVTTIEALKSTLINPKYKDAELIFSNVLPSGQLVELAKKDKMSSINKLGISFLDFYSLENHFFTFNIPTENEIISNSDVLLNDAFLVTDINKISFGSLNPFLMRQVEGIIAICSITKLTPVFCFMKGSEICKVFVTFITRYIKENPDLQRLFSSFERSKKGNIKIYIGGRLDDPVTPMITTWNYQSMVNDLLETKDGQIMIPNRKPIQFNCINNDFFNSIKNLPFGDLAVKLQQKIEEFKGKRKKLETLKEMVEFIRDFPEFSKRQSEITKHVKICDMLSSIVEKRNLITLSEIEQKVVGGENNNETKVKVEDFISDAKNNDHDKIKLAILFILANEVDFFKSNNNQEFINFKNKLLNNIELKNKIMATSILNNVIQKFGTGKRSGVMIDKTGWFKIARRILVGVNDVFTQHKPLHVKNFMNVLDGYNVKEFNFVNVHNIYIEDESKINTELNMFYVVGGITYYEKAKIKNNLVENKSNKNVIVGGSSILNSNLFFDIIIK